MGKVDNKAVSKALFKNTGIIAIGQVGTKLINFFLLPLYTTLLTKEEYGILDLVTTYSTFLVVIVGLQISQALFRYLATSREDRQQCSKIVSTSIAGTVVCSVLFCTIFVVVQPFITLKYKWYLLAHILVSVFLQLMSGISRGLGKNGHYAVGNFLAASITLVLNVVAIAVLHLGVEAMLVSYLIGPFVGGCYLFFRCGVYRYMSLKKANYEDFKVILRYSLPLVPNELSWSVIHASDRVIVSAVLGVAANGLIAVASKFSAIYTTVFSMFNASWTEQVVLHYKDEGGPEYVSEMFDKVVTFFATMAIGIIACMPFVFDLLVKKEFSEAYNLVPLYMIAVFFNAVIGMISSIYLINNETKLVAISTMVAAGINIVAGVVLIHFIGIYAAPVSSICGYVAISVWRYIDVNRRHCKVHLKKKNVMGLLIALFLSLMGYYSSQLLIRIIGLGGVMLLAFLLNKTMIIETLGVLRSIRKRR